MKQIAVFFPGIGYHCDKPLLYFSILESVMEETRRYIQRESVSF